MPRIYFLVQEAYSTKTQNNNNYKYVAYKWILDIDNLFAKVFLGIFKGGLEYFFHKKLVRVTDLKI